MISNPERLAYWYFRLNGFFTFENFIVHPDKGNEQRTDADLLAVRFVHRAENLERPMEDDPRVASCDYLANVIIAEVKKRECCLNGPWTNPERQNMQRVIKSIGCVPEGSFMDACKALYETGKWADNHVMIRLFAIGQNKNPSLLVGKDQQITWSEIIGFCRKRFQKYKREKSSVPQWTDDGIKLQELCQKSGHEEAVRKHFNLPSIPTNSDTP